MLSKLKVVLLIPFCLLFVSASSIKPLKVKGEILLPDVNEDIVVNLEVIECVINEVIELFIYVNDKTVIDGERYIDGAFTNSVPSDVVRQMGADYVVAIDLSTRESKVGVLKKIFPT